MRTLDGWRYRTTALGLCMTVYFGSRAVQVALSTLAPDIVTTLSITMGLFGLAFTGLSIMSALVQLPGGALSDRYGERILIMTAIVLTLVSVLLLALAPSFLVFLPMMVFVGIGSGLYYSPSTALLDRLYNQIGRAIGIYRTSGKLSGVFAPVIVGAVSVYFGWRVAIFAMGLLLVPVFAGVLIFMEPTPPRNPASLRNHSSAHRLLTILSKPVIAGTTALAGCIQFVEVASFTFLPALLRQHHGLSVGQASGLFTVYFGVVTVTQPVTGWLSDRLSRDSVTVITLLSGLIGFALLTQQTTFPLLAAAVILAGVSMTWAAPVQSKFMDNLSETELGVGFGLVRSIYLLMGALGSYIIGVLITEVGWVFAFSSLAGLLAFCLIGITASKLVHLFSQLRYW